MKKIDLKPLIEENISKMFGISLNEANVEQLYKACATTTNDILRKKRKDFNHKVKEQKGKRVYYLSIEFLMGRSLKNNIHNLDLVDDFQSVLSQIGYSLEDLYEKEPDAGLGNGGLGRLGACYLDALTTGQYPAMGFSIRYEYGLFKQKFTDGWQTELPDVWLPGGEVWLTMRGDKTYHIRFDGHVEEKNVDGKTIYEHKGYQEVEAVPYDMMVSGADSEAVSVLRLWKSQNIRNFDINSFSQGNYLKAIKEANDADLISKLLYPSDDHYEGKTLRLKQQYFMVSASIQNIISDQIRYYGDVRTLSKYVAIHINDTHPALAVPELMRILIDEHNLDFKEAWDIVTKTFAYTNHTVLAEALEQWPVELLSKKLPRIYLLLKQINEYFLDEARCQGVNNGHIEALSLFGNGNVRMANLSVIASMKVNGVSKLHSEIIKNSIFKDFYKLNPDKFINVTNGIAYRRWLNQSNPRLAKLLEKCDGFYHNASNLECLLNYVEDDDVLAKLEMIKYQNKCDFAKFLYKQQGVVVDPNTRFDVQVKRLHEYKRQLLNALKIIALLVEIEENPNLPVVPQTFIFGAKAAQGYYVAKQIIELINYISKEIQLHPNIKEKLNVVFVEDYNVTIAEKLIPASEVSEQISLAGKEASGTGNMKFMINGALTLGTLDGANVEISEAVGDDNIFIFGMKDYEVAKLWEKGYRANDYYDKNPVIRKVIDRLNKGFAGKPFDHISRYLLDNYPISDPYMCLADFEAYMNAHYKMNELYKDKRRWNQMSLVNIAKAGIFSADRSIKEYAENIWNLKEIK